MYVHRYMYMSSVQLLSPDSAMPWTEAHQASLSITNFWSLLKLMSIQSVMPSKHFILFSPSPLAFNLFQHKGLFKRISSSHQVAKVLEFQLLHPSNEYSGLISFRIDWFDLLAIYSGLISFRIDWFNLIAIVQNTGILEWVAFSFSRVSS